MAKTGFGSSRDLEYNFPRDDSEVVKGISCGDGTQCGVLGEGVRPTYCFRDSRRTWNSLDRPLIVPTDVDGYQRLCGGAVGEADDVLKGALEARHHISLVAGSLFVEPVVGKIHESAKANGYRVVPGKRTPDECCWAIRGEVNAMLERSCDLAPLLFTSCAPVDLGLVNERRLARINGYKYDPNEGEGKGESPFVTVDLPNVTLDMHDRFFANYVERVVPKLVDELVRSVGRGPSRLTDFGCHIPDYYELFTSGFAPASNPQFLQWSDKDISLPYQPEQEATLREMAGIAFRGLVEGQGVHLFHCPSGIGKSVMLGRCAQLVMDIVRKNGGGDADVLFLRDTGVLFSVVKSIARHRMNRPVILFVDECRRSLLSANLAEVDPKLLWRGLPGRVTVIGAANAPLEVESDPCRWELDSKNRYHHNRARAAMGHYNHRFPGREWTPAVRRELLEAREK